MFWELSGDRTAAMLGTLDLWLRRRAALRASAGSALFLGTFGLLDAQGNAAAAIDFPQAPVLPPLLLGLSVHACTWLLAVGAGNGEPSNPIEIRFVP